VQLPYTLGDNGGPSQAWAILSGIGNERYVTPRLILRRTSRCSRIREALRRNSPRRARRLHSLLGGRGSLQAYELLSNRATVDRLIQGETCVVDAAPTAYPASNTRRMEQSGLLRRATWGAHNRHGRARLTFCETTVEDEA